MTLLERSALWMTSAAWTFSMLSNFDCRFTKVNVGFHPANSALETSEFGVGLWTFENVENRCVEYSTARYAGSVVGRGTHYRNWFMNNDTSWCMSRLSAFVSLISGLVAIISLCMEQFFLTGRRRKSKQAKVTAIATMFALLSEIAKIISFFLTDLCMSQQIWQLPSNDTIYGTNTSKAEKCSPGRGAIACIVSILTYFVPLILCLKSTVNK